MIEPRFDFKTGEFSFSRNGNITLVAGKSALKGKIEKMLHTPLYSHPIDKIKIGTDAPDMLVGKGLPAPYAIAEAERVLRERIGSIEGVTGITEFEMSKQGSRLCVKIKLATIYGDINDTEELSYYG